MEAKRVMGAFGLLALAAVMLTAHAVDPTPEQRALGFVQVLLAGDQDAALDYLRDNLTPDKWASREESDWKSILGMLAGDAGGGEVAAVDVTGPDHVDVAVDAGPGLMRFGFDFEPDAPHRIAGLAVRVGGPGEGDGPKLPSPALRPGMPDDQVSGVLDSYFQGLADKDVFSGTVLVAKDGEPVFTAAHGMASKRFDVPNRLDTRFDVGSINKDFTKISIAKLHAEGKLTLDDTLVSHLPDYPNADVARSVTIGQLVDHTAGLPDIFGPAFFEASKAEFRDNDDYFALFADEPLLFEPGTSKRYSNAGYVVLGAVIESVSGVAYDEYVERNVFAPAGMDDSGFFAHDEPVKNVAIGYTKQGLGGRAGTLRNNLFMLPIVGNGAGSAYSTAEDLLKFDNALRGHVLLPPNYTRWVFDGPEPDPDDPGERDGAPRLDIGAGLAGGAPGVSAVIEIEGDLVLIVLSNYDAPIAEDIAEAVMPGLKRALR